ncbi:MAG: hypothetical protein FWG65_03580 [Turicibacter sp.]|nr:hypothetical protein [Turicibacter sp.]
MKLKNTTKRTTAIVIAIIMSMSIVAANPLNIWANEDSEIAVGDLIPPVPEIDFDDDEDEEIVIYPELPEDEEIDIDLDDLIPLTPEIDFDGEGEPIVIHPEVDFDEESEIMPPQGIFGEFEPFVYDDEPPVLHSVSVSPQIVNAPGVVTVTVEATDNLSGIEVIDARFIDANSNREYMAFGNVAWSWNLIAENTFQTEIAIGQYDPPGLFELALVWITDVAGNQQMYVLNPSQWGNDVLPLPNNAAFTISNTNYDNEPPVLHNVQVTPVVNAPGVVTVTVEATDNLSGIEVIDARFIDANSNREYMAFGNVAWSWNLIAENTFQTEIPIGQYDPPGLFELALVWITDVAGNQQTYVLNPSQWGNDVLPLPNNAAFTITNTNYDNEPPVLHNVQVSPQVVNAPGVVTVTVTATDNLSGIEIIQANFIDANSNREYVAFGNVAWSWNLIAENTFQTEITIGQYDPPGLFELAWVWITDVAGNQQMYVLNPSQWGNDVLPLPNNAAFEIAHDRNADLATNTANPNLIQDILSQPNDAVIIINYATGANIPTDVFTAIQGTSRTVILQQSNGIEWVFYGGDITAPSAINANVALSSLDNFTGGNKNYITNLVQENPAMILSFTNHGELPGRATIRVRADFAFRNVVGNENLNVYHFDSTNNRLVPVAENLNVSEEDGFLEFVIYHNSDFVITGQRGTPPIIIPPPTLTPPPALIPPFADNNFWEEQEFRPFIPPRQRQVFNVTTTDDGATLSLPARVNSLGMASMQIPSTAINQVLGTARGNATAAQNIVVTIVPSANDVEGIFATLDRAAFSSLIAANATLQVSNGTFTLEFAPSTLTEIMHTTRGNLRINISPQTALHSVPRTTIGNRPVFSFDIRGTASGAIGTLANAISFSIAADGTGLFIAQVVGNRINETPSTFANGVLTWNTPHGGIFGVGSR